MKNCLSFLIGFLLVICVRTYCLAASPMESDSHKSHQHEMTQAENIELSGKLENGIRVVKVKASRYKFEPDPIVVKLGEKVRLVVTSTDAAHGLAISGFKVNLPVPSGQTRSIEFIADKKGTFHVYCSVYCGPGHGHMHGRFIIIKN